MIRHGLVRSVAGLSRRIVRRTRVTVLGGPTLSAEFAVPEGCRLVRFDRNASAEEERQVERAMQAVGESAGLVRPRLARGDEFVGWQQNDDILCFGWICYRERLVGPVRLIDAPGRVFLYNFQTRADCRGRRLYPALLGALRTLLGREGMREIFGEVNVRNVASARGVDRAGFGPVGEIAYVTLAGRWHVAVSKRRNDATAACPF